MEFNILISLVFYCFSLGCIQSKNQLPALDTSPDQDTTVVSEGQFDTIQKVEIQKIIDEINIGVRDQGRPTSIAFPFFNSDDTLDYWTVNREPARISLPMQTDQTVEWPTFFVSNGELIFVRYRTWHGDDAFPWVMESMVYLEEGKIVYCDERRLDLMKGEAPARLRQEPYKISTRTPDDIEKDYKKYWDKVSEFLQIKK